MPRVDVIAWLTVAGSKAVVVVHQHDESGIGEHPSESLQPVFLYSGEPVRHGDGRMPAGALRGKQPTTQDDPAQCRELHILALRHHFPFTDGHAGPIFKCAPLNTTPADMAAAVSADGRRFITEHVATRASIL